MKNYYEIYKTYFFGLKNITNKIKPIGFYPESITIQNKYKIDKL